MTLSDHEPIRRLSSADNFCFDILKGLAVHFESAFITDILETARRYPLPELGFSLNRNQTISKKWLIKSLYRANSGPLGQVYILGGWYGVLAAMLLHDSRFKISKAISIDIDPQCKDIAHCLNGTHMANGSFHAVTADMSALNYTEDALSITGSDGGTHTATFRPNLIINTSCEHLEDFDAWYGCIPPGTLMVLQSNNYVGIKGHVNCVESLNAFKEQAKMAGVLFEGELKLEKYTRFMLIGKK